MKKAFTLLEVMIVMIILGVLVTMAFVQYGRVVDHAKALEAINQLKHMHDAIQRCILKRGIDELNAGIDDIAGCIPNPGGGPASFSMIDIGDPLEAPGSHFQWDGRSSGGSQVPARYYYSYRLRYNSPEDLIVFQYCNVDVGGEDCFGVGADRVCVNRTRGVTIAGAGIFAGIKQGAGIQQ